MGELPFDLFSPRHRRCNQQYFTGKELVIGIQLQKTGTFLISLNLGAELFYAPVMLGVWYRGLANQKCLTQQWGFDSTFGVFPAPNDLQVGYSLWLLRFPGWAGENSRWCPWGKSVRYTFRNYKAGKSMTGPYPGIQILTRLDKAVSASIFFCLIVRYFEPFSYFYLLNPLGTGKKISSLWSQKGERLKGD